MGCRFDIKLHRYTPLDNFIQRGIVFFMSKRKRSSQIEKWIKDGRGAGIGVNYKTWYLP